VRSARLSRGPLAAVKAKIKELLTRVWISTLLWAARRIYKLNRLDALSPIPLRGITPEATQKLREPVRQYEPDVPGAITLEYEISPFHFAIVTEWEGAVHELSYESIYPDPDRDLKWMLETYDSGAGWSVMTEGYSFRANDGSCFLWCSAAPVLGVSTAEYLEAKAAARRAARTSAPLPSGG
jgi:hypothetical protein